MISIFLAPASIEFSINSLRTEAGLSTTSPAAIASLVPFEVLENCFKGLEISLLVSKKGNINSITDAGVASESFMAGANSAYLNILIKYLLQ